MCHKSAPKDYTKVPQCRNKDRYLPTTPGASKPQHGGVALEIPALKMPLSGLNDSFRNLSQTERCWNATSKSQGVNPSLFKESIPECYHHNFLLYLLYSIWQAQLWSLAQTLLHPVLTFGNLSLTKEDSLRWCHVPS